MVGYKVVGADNAHYMDATEHAEHGVFETYAAAVAVCRDIVERSLAWQYKPGMSAAELYDYYTSFGDDPSSSRWARRRSANASRPGPMPRSDALRSAARPP